MSHTKDLCFFLLKSNFKVESDPKLPCHLVTLVLAWFKSSIHHKAPLLMLITFNIAALFIFIVEITSNTISSKTVKNNPRLLKISWQ